MKIKWITFLTSLTKRWNNAPTAHTKLQGFPLVILSNLNPFLAKKQGLPLSNFLSIFWQTCMASPSWLYQILAHFGQKYKAYLYPIRIQIWRTCKAKTNQLISWFPLFLFKHSAIENWKTLYKSQVWLAISPFFTIKKLHPSQKGESMPQISAHLRLKMQGWPPCYYIKPSAHFLQNSKLCDQSGFIKYFNKNTRLTPKPCDFFLISAHFYLDPRLTLFFFWGPVLVFFILISFE